MQGADVVVAQSIEDELELPSGGGHGADVAVAAAMSHLFADRADAAGVWQHLHRLDRRPPHQARALFGDPAAVHGGVGFVVSGCESGPRRQLTGPGESVHVTDLGDKHRSQHRADAEDPPTFTGTTCQLRGSGQDVDQPVQTRGQAWGGPPRVLGFAVTQSHSYPVPWPAARHLGAYTAALECDHTDNHLN